MIYTVHMSDKLEHLRRIAILIVIVCNQLEELVVQSDAHGSVEDGCVSITDEVDGDTLIFYIFQNALQLILGCSLHCRIDLFQRRRRLQHDVLDGRLQQGIRQRRRRNDFCQR